MSQAWPADAVVRRPLASLVPYAKNARTHSETQVAQIAASIRAWGFTVPVLVDEAGTLIAGHGRLLAAQQLGLADVPVMVATGWTKAQVAAYRLADNKLALNAGWDTEALTLELTDLEAAGFDITLAGFTGDERTGDDPDNDPSDDPGSYAEQYGVIVMCRDEAHQQQIFERLSADGLQVKVVAT